MKTNLLSKKINFKKNGRLFGFGSSPEADWKIIFTLFSAIAIIGIALNVFIFLKIDKGEIFAVEDPASGEGRMVDYEKLKSAVDYYQEKERNFRAIQSNASTTVISDPSI